MTRMLIGIALGSLLGITSRYYSFLNWLSIIPWGIAGFCLGCYCRTKKEATIAGILYGFALGFVFLIAGYTGSASLLSRLPFFALLAAFSAVCGLIASLVGFVVKKMFVTHEAPG